MPTAYAQVNARIPVDLSDLLHKASLMLGVSKQEIIVQALRIRLSNIKAVSRG